MSKICCTFMSMQNHCIRTQKTQITCLTFKLHHHLTYFAHTRGIFPCKYYWIWNMQASQKYYYLRPFEVQIFSVKIKVWNFSQRKFNKYYFSSVFEIVQHQTWSFVCKNMMPFWPEQNYKWQKVWQVSTWLKIWLRSKKLHFNQIPCLKSHNVWQM